MNRALACLAFLLLLSPALAQSDAVKISADQFQLNDKSGAATFSGSVVVSRTGFTMNADNVVVRYGTGGQSDIDNLVASGNVRIKTREQEATGATASFDPGTQLLRLSGGVTVVNASGRMTGPELTIDLRDNSTTFRGGSGGRVTGVFTPQ